MTVKKTAALIFAEVPEAIDETWSHGAVMGGMCGWDDESLAESYFLAGDALVEAVLTGSERGQDLVNPVMFSYRHAIELYLKSIVQPKDRNHSLGSLLQAFCRHIQERYNETVPAWITRPITELAQFDPGSDLFRYEKTKPESRSARVQNEGEFWIDLRAIKKMMAPLRRAFRRVSIADLTGRIPDSPIG